MYNDSTIKRKTDQLPLTWKLISIKPKDNY